MTINMWIASVAWFCLIIGYLMRKHPSLHAKLMLAGITADITLVLYLQFTRSAIQKAIGPSMELLPRLHVVSSTLGLLLYFPVMYYGFTMLRSGSAPEVVAKHKRLALPALIFRTVGFGLMFPLIRS